MNEVDIDASSNVIVTIFSFGEEVAQLNRTLRQDDVWLVADIEVPSMGLTVLDQSYE